MLDVNTGLMGKVVKNRAFSKAFICYQYFKFQFFIECFIYSIRSQLFIEADLGEFLDKISEVYPTIEFRIRHHPGLASAILIL